MKIRCKCAGCKREIEIDTDLDEIALCRDCYDSMIDDEQLRDTNYNEENDYDLV